jgi:ABC-2 type transport system permease protein
MTTTIERTPSSTRAAPGFRAAMASEWVKLWTLPFNVRMLLAAMVLCAVTAVLLIVTYGLSLETSLAEIEPIRIVEASMVAADFTAIIIAVLAATAVASEFSTGMIAVTLAAIPRRLRVVGAKAIVWSVTAIVAGMFAALTAFAAGQATLLVQGAQGISLFGDPRVLRLMYAAMLWAPVCTLFAVAFAFIFRRAGSAIAALLLVMSLELPINQLPIWGRAAVLPLAPPQALYNLSGLAVPSDVAYASPGSAAFVLVLWTGVLYGLAYKLLKRRDM